MILDEAVDRFLASSRGGETRPGEVAIFDAPLAERLGFWSDLWRQSQEIAARDPSWRSPAADDRSARFSSAGARTAGPSGRTEAMRLHIERMSELESGRFVDDALKRAGRSTAQPVDMTRFRDFAEVVRFSGSRLRVHSRAHRGRRALTSQTPARLRLQAGFTARSWTKRHAGTGRSPARARRLRMSALSSTPASPSASRHGLSAGREPRSAPT